MRSLSRSFSFLRFACSSLVPDSRWLSRTESAARHLSTSASYLALGTYRSYNVNDQNARYSSGEMSAQVSSGNIPRTVSSSSRQVIFTPPMSSATDSLHSSTLLSLDGVGRGLRCLKTGL